MKEYVKRHKGTIITLVGSATTALVTEVMYRTELGSDLIDPAVIETIQAGLIAIVLGALGIKAKKEYSNMQQARVADRAKWKPPGMSALVGVILSGIMMLGLGACSSIYPDDSYDRNINSQMWDIPTIEPKDGCQTAYRAQAIKEELYRKLEGYITSSEIAVVEPLWTSLSNGYVLGDMSEAKAAEYHRDIFFGMLSATSGYLLDKGVTYAESDWVGRAQYLMMDVVNDAAARGRIISATETAVCK